MFLGSSLCHVFVSYNNSAVMQDVSTREQGGGLLARADGTGIWTQRQMVSGHLRPYGENGRAKLPSSSKGRNTAIMFLIYHNDNSLFHAITSVKCILTVCKSYTGLLTQVKVTCTMACFPLHASHRAVWRCEHARVSPPARGGGTAHVPGGVARGSACCPAALPRYQAGSLPPASQTSS